MTDPTRATRPVGGPPSGAPPPSPPGGPPPGGPGGPAEPGGPDWRRITIGALAALTTLLALVLVLVLLSGGDDGDDDGDVATRGTTSTASTTTSSTSSSTTSSTTTSTTTTEPTTTTAEPVTTTTTTTTTTAPTPSTVAPARCTGRTDPARPEPVAEVFYEAWTVDDRRCAQRVATEEAIEDLFVFDGRSAEWSFEGCEQDDDLPESDCFFRYEGGSATFRLRFGAVDGWRVESVTFTAD